MTLNWPNFISLLRLFSVPVLVWLILQDHMMAAFFTATIAGLSDIVDGLMARMLKSSTTVGAYLDPIADKVLLVGLYLTLGYKGMIPLWLVILIIGRDVLISGGILLLLVLKKNFKPHPIFISKMNTFLQIMLVAWILGSYAFAVKFTEITQALLLAVTFTTIYSGCAYVMIGLKYFNSNTLSAR